MFHIKCRETLRSLRNGAWVFTAALTLIILGHPTSARAQMLNPFAGQMGSMGVMGAMGPQNLAPYGAQSGAMGHLLQSENGLMMSSQSSVPNLMNGLSRLLGLEARARQFPIARENMTMSEGLMGEVPGAMERGVGEIPGAAEGGEIEAPEVDVGEGIVELIVGACAGGAFIGAFSAATAAPAAAAPIAGAAAVVAAPLVVTAFATAMGFGCLLGVSTATISVGAVLGYRGLAQ